MQGKKLVELAIGKLAPALNIRTHFDRAELEALAETMKRLGVEHPLHVRPDGDRFVITDGERRYRAALLAELKTVPVIVEDKSLSDVEVVERQLIADCRETLRPLDKAKAIRRLVKEAGWTVSEAASRLGMSLAQVSKLLALLELPDAIRGRVESGDIPVSAAYEIARVVDPVEREALAQEVAAGRLNRDALSGARKSSRSASGSSKQAVPSRIKAVLGKGRWITIQAPALTLESMISVIEELLARARRARPKGLSLATFLQVLNEEASSCQQ